MSNINNPSSSAYSTGNVQSQLDKDPYFISFNNSPCQSFTPPHCSSPLKSDNYRKKNWNNSRNSKIYNRSPNNSYGNHSRNYSNNSSYNERQYSWPQRGSSSEDKKDISRYLHPSFMEDPWKRLEGEYSRKEKLDK